MSARRSDLSITVVLRSDRLQTATLLETHSHYCNARRSDLSITVVAVCLLDGLT